MGLSGGPPWHRTGAAARCKKNDGGFGGTGTVHPILLHLAFTYFPPLISEGTMR
jgi:hypothetical protein